MPTPRPQRRDPVLEMLRAVRRGLRGTGRANLAPVRVRRDRGEKA